MEFRTFLGIIICSLTFVMSPLKAQPIDSVEVSLLTCSPHEEIYSLYGHSALRWHNLRTGEDVAFNWGIFNFDTPHFILKFIFGLTDYELGLMSYEVFCSYYAHWGSGVTEQVLNLTDEEKQKLQEALRINQMPENKVYRYNCFYDNCSTRPRNIIEKCINGKVEYAQRENYTTSFRDLTRYATRNHPWAMFGNDILLGVKADAKIGRSEQEFLPENLMYDIDHAQIYADGNYRPLVKERRIAVKPGVQVIEEDFPLTPTQCACLLLALSIAIWVWEWKRKKTFVWWDFLLMALQGLAGCVLFLMLFSQHPTTSTNLQVLLLNPLPFFFIPSVVRRKPTKWRKVLACMIILFVIGGFFQHYAEGMFFVALSLLTRVNR